MQGKFKGRLKIPESAWSDLADLNAGSVAIDDVHICSMHGREAGQYYRVTHSLALATRELLSVEVTPASAAAAPGRAVVAAASPVAAAALATAVTAPLVGPAAVEETKPPPAVTLAASAVNKQVAERPDLKPKQPLATAKQRFKQLLSALTCGPHLRKDKREQGGTGGGSSYA
eukprot:GHRR01030964.1.p1 GENE.GHRR01030964.1~~GHRR01030964.1.p1  ORF type:complete len:173 (+),score=75.62 GHRR01030964.1:232-750(+)